MPAFQHIENLKQFLDEKVTLFETNDFIPFDPITIPHRFTKKQDIEIAAFFAAILAWGNRKSIINSCTNLLKAMDNAPYDFIINHTEKDRKGVQSFVHRTFNAHDLFHFFDFLQMHYRFENQNSLETAFMRNINMETATIEEALNSFYNYFFNPTLFPYQLARTKKHVAAPQKKSACKRLNMFLRWMVRSSSKGVDFGLWKSITPAQLICPLDVHVARVSRNLGLIEHTQNNWKTALALTSVLKELDAQDPVKYDFALFGLGVSEKY